MRKKIEIKDISVDTHGEKMRVTYELLIENDGIENFPFYYEFDKRFENDIVSDRIDAIVLGILEYAMYHNLDIVSEIPIMSELYIGLTDSYMPCLVRNVKQFHNIRILAPIVDVEWKEKQGVGVSFSGGVDSFYAFFRHMKNGRIDDINCMLTANVGAFGFIGGVVSKNAFDKTVYRFTHIASEYNLKYIAVNTNSMEFYANQVNALKEPDALKTAACIYLFGNYFRLYYFSSSYPIEDFKLDFKERSYYDLLTLKCISNRSIKFVSSGQEVGRMEKLDFIKAERVVRKYLSVCYQENNCGRCYKCTRTMLNLDVLGVLDNYSEVFDIDFYKRNKARILGEKFALSHEKTYTKDTLSYAKKNRVKLPIFKAKLYQYFIFYPIHVLKALVRSIRKLVSL
jgi:hypothetical protein